MQVDTLLAHSRFTDDLRVGDTIVTVFEPDGSPKTARIITHVEEWDEGVYQVAWREGGTTARADERWFVLNNEGEAA